MSSLDNGNRQNWIPLRNAADRDPELGGQYPGGGDEDTEAFWVSSSPTRENFGRRRAGGIVGASWQQRLDRLRRWSHRAGEDDHDHPHYAWRQSRLPWMWIVPGTIVLVVIVVLVLSSLSHKQIMASGPSESGGAASQCFQPPEAIQIAKTRTVHGHSVVDPFDWMGKPTAEQKLALREYIAKENAYTDRILNQTLALQQQLLQEMHDMDRRNDSTAVPLQTFPFEDVWIMSAYVYARFEPMPDQSYAVYRRWPKLDANTGASLAIELSRFRQFGLALPGMQILLDLNQEALKHANESAYIALGVLEVSPDEQLLAYSLDLVGNEKFTVFFRQLTASEVSNDLPGKSITDTYYNLRWLGNDWVYFNRMDAQDMPMRVEKYCVQNCADVEPMLVYEETDSKLTAEVVSSSDQKYVFIKSVGQVTAHYLLVNELDGKVTPFTDTSEKGVLHSVDHGGDFFYTLSNKGAPNGALYQTPENNTAFHPANATILVPHDPRRYLEKFELFRNFILVWFWEDGQKMAMQMDLPFVLNVTVPKILRLGHGSVYALNSAMGEYPVRRVYSSTSFTFYNNTYLQPTSGYEYNMDTSTIATLFQNKPKYPLAPYRESRHFLPTYDGKQRIVMDMVEKVDDLVNATRRAYVEAYGAYGGIWTGTYDAYTRLLLDRGYYVIYLFIRGEGNLGVEQYRSGKMEWKMNTFLDLRTALLWLVQNKYVRPGHIALKGRSAGGLVSGSAANWFGFPSPGEAKRPELRGTHYPPAMLEEIKKALDPKRAENRLVGAVIVPVPFVGVVNDMLDPIMPWTAYEYEEWGNPGNETIYNSMMDYSPYETIIRQDLPAMLVMGGFQDTRVQFHEPTKFVAKLRLYKTNNLPPCPDSPRNATASPLLLEINEFGHFGGTGEDAYRERARMYAFILHNLS